MILPDAQPGRSSLHSRAGIPGKGRLLVWANVKAVKQADISADLSPKFNQGQETQGKLRTWHHHSRGSDLTIMKCDLMVVCTDSQGQPIIRVWCVQLPQAWPVSLKMLWLFWNNVLISQKINYRIVMWPDDSSTGEQNTRPHKAT